MLKNKFFIFFVLFVTWALGGVAIYTALRLKEKGSQPIAPSVPKKSYAFECSDYQLTIDTNGTVRITNNSDSPQPTQTIDLLINGVSVGTFTIPALDPQTNAALGNINLPTGDFDWSIQGLTGCTKKGTNQQQLTSCSEVNLVLAAEISQTPTPTSSYAPSATPTSGAYTTHTPTLSLSVTNSPTPTFEAPPIPDSGVNAPTFTLLVLGSFIILVSLILSL